MKQNDLLRIAFYLLGFTLLKYSYESIWYMDLLIAALFIIGTRIK